MKSIKEKAKAYDEALERAKGVIEQNPLMEYLKKGIEYILPELKENEDERIRKGIIRNLEYLMDRAEGFVKDELKERIAWLEKRPKDSPVISNPSNTGKVEQKPAWSEEDEYCIHQLIVFCENCMVQDDGAKRCAKWLKSLKDRYTWKPSDEQIKTLENVRKILHSKDIYSKAKSLMYNFEELIRTITKLKE